MFLSNFPIGIITPDPLLSLSPVFNKKSYKTGYFLEGKKESITNWYKMLNGRECLDVNPVWHFSYILGRWFIHRAPLLYTELFFLYPQLKYFSCLLCKVTSHTITSTQTGVSVGQRVMQRVRETFLNRGEEKPQSIHSHVYRNKISPHTQGRPFFIAVLKVWKTLCFAPKYFLLRFFLAESFPRISNSSLSKENSCSAWDLSIRCCSRTSHMNQTDCV